MYENLHRCFLCMWLVWTVGFLCSGSWKYTVKGDHLYNSNIHGSVYPEVINKGDRTCAYSYFTKCFLIQDRKFDCKLFKAFGWVLRFLWYNCIVCWELRAKFTWWEHQNLIIMNLTLLPFQVSPLRLFHLSVLKRTAELARKAVELFGGRTIIGTEVLGRCTWGCM